MKKQSNQARPGLPRRWATGSLLAAGILLFSVGAMSASDDGVDDVQATRKALEEWTETQRIISKEENDWRIGREILQGQIELTQRQIAAVHERIGEAQESISEAEGKLEALETEKQELEATAAVIGDLVADLEARTRALLAKLPPSVGAVVDTMSQRLPANAEQAAKQSLSDRFLTIVGILNDLNKFNREVKLVTEIRELDGGKMIEVETLYVGLGQAFYANADGTIAGFGAATEEGWTWTPASEHAARISQLVKIAQGSEQAAFVQLPIEIK